MMKPEPDLAECAACLCLASRRAARSITRMYERHMRPHGIHATQFTALVMLSTRGPLTIGELARTIDLERTAASRNLARLEAQGWVNISGGADDARSRVVALTRKGRSLLGAALPAWRKAQSAAVAMIGDSGADALRSLAAKSFR